MNRKRIVQVIAISGFIVGAVLIGVGTAGAATPFIVAGVILIFAAGAGGFMASMEQSSLRPLTSTNVPATS